MCFSSTVTPNDSEEERKKERKKERKEKQISDCLSRWSRQKSTVPYLGTLNILTGRGGAVTGQSSSAFCLQLFMATGIGQFFVPFQNCNLRAAGVEGICAL